MKPRKVAGYGWRPDTPDHRDHQYLPEPLRVPSRIPLKATLRDNPAMPPVFDQGQLGSCTYNAIGSLAEYVLNVEGKGFGRLSRLFGYYEERVIEGTVKSDAGAELRDGMRVLGTAGTPPEPDWPYDTLKFAKKPPAKAYKDAALNVAVDYARVPVGHGALRACIAGGKPFVFGFSVPESFESPQMANGATRLLELPQPGEQIVGGHAVKAVGYDFTRRTFRSNVFEVKNSWGADWCDQGYFYIDAAYFADPQLANDLWTLSVIT